MEDGCGIVGKYHCFNFKQFFLFSMFDPFFSFLERFWGIAIEYRVKSIQEREKNLSFRANSENREKSLNEQS